MKIFPIGKWLGKKQLNFGLFHVNFPYPLKYFDWEMAREKGVASGSIRVNFMLCQHGAYPKLLESQRNALLDSLDRVQKILLKV